MNPFSPHGGSMGDGNFISKVDRLSAVTAHRKTTKETDNELEVEKAKMLQLLLKIKKKGHKRSKSRSAMGRTTAFSTI